MSSLLSLLPFPLGARPSEAALASATNGFQWDCAIGGLPFLMGIEEEVPLRRETLDYQREQFDNARDPGEQSLSGWWLRSQSRFDGGAGIRFFEPMVDEASSDRFASSVGVEVHEPGEVRLCKRMDQVSLSVGTIVDIDMGPTYLYVLGTTAVAQVTNAGVVTTLGWSPPSGATSIAVGPDGGVWVGATGGVYKDGTAVWTTSAGACKVWWAKSRLFVIQGPDMFQLSTAGGSLDSETPIPLPELATSDWTWLDVTETPAAVWAAAVNSFGQSKVFAVTLAELDVVLLESLSLPRGEDIKCVSGYLDYLTIGTSRGVRVCVTQGTDAAMGPLLVAPKEEYPVQVATAVGDAVFAVSTASHDGNTGVVRVDLSDELNGRFPWARETYLSGVSAAAVGVSVFPSNKRLAIATAGGLWLQSLTTTVPSGWLQTGYTRWGTWEMKWFESVTVQADVSDGTILVSSADLVNTYPLGSIADDVAGGTVRVKLPGVPGELLAVRFRLEAGTSEGPVLHGYQLRATPSPRRQRVIEIPLLMYDLQVDRNGNRYGRPMFGAARQFALEQLEEQGAPVVLQDYRTGENRRCLISKVTHIQTSPPDREHPNAAGLTLVRLVALDTTPLDSSDFDEG